MAKPFAVLLDGVRFDAMMKVKSAYAGAVNPRSRTVTRTGRKSCMRNGTIDKARNLLEPISFIGSGAASQQRPGVRGDGTAAPRHGMGRGPAVSAGTAGQVRRPWVDGDPVPRGIRRGGDVVGRLLPVHRGAGACRPVGLP